MKKYFQIIILLTTAALIFVLWFTQKAQYNKASDEIKSTFIQNAESFSFEVFQKSNFLLSNDSIKSIIDEQSINFGNIVFIPEASATTNQTYQNIFNEFQEAGNEVKLYSQKYSDYLILGYPAVAEITIVDSIGTASTNKNVVGFWFTEFHTPAFLPYEATQNFYLPAFFVLLMALTSLLAYNPLVLSYTRVQQKLNEKRNDLNDKQKEVEQLKILVNRSAEINNRNLKFIDEIQKIETEKEIKEKFLPSLCESIGAVQGVVFLKDKKENIMNAIGGYAVDRDLESLSFKPGDGLVGETFNTGKLNIIEKIPANYLKVTSGLGNTESATLALVPLTSGDKVLGIIEIASFKTFDEFDRNFFESISRNLGARVSLLKL
jgi:putative methionine-R-sulfoxide reductase with GAF domain